MSAEDDVTVWLERLKTGDDLAAQKLWECYFHRLVRLARHKLQGLPRRASDEEDVALSAFHSFCQGVEQGRFPRLVDRDDLWHLLVVLTARKACDLKQYERRQKRGGGATLSADDSDQALADLISREPTPEFAAQVAEECQALLRRLGDPLLQSIAIWKMEGYSIEQIASKLNCVPRTIERKLKLIRGQWEREEAGHG